MTEWGHEQNSEAANSSEVILKHRIKKSYRIPELDEKIRKARTKSEAKIIEKLKEIIDVPKIIKVDEKTKKFSWNILKGKNFPKIWII